MKLHLHIGSEKTGTTTTQNWFAKNRALLAENGVYYPESLRRKNGPTSHRLLSVLAMDYSKWDTTYTALCIDSEESFAARVSETIQNFSDEFSQYKHINNWVISSEHLQSRLKDANSVARIYSFLKPYFSEIVVYIHLRPQIDLAVSRASTGARSGFEINRQQFEPPQITEDYYDYLGLVRRWSDVFGTENVVVIPYKRVPDFMRYITGQLGLKPNDYQPVDRENEALGWRVIALTNTLQNNGNTMLLQRALSTGVLGRMDPGEKLQVGLELADAVQARFEQGNNALIAQRHELQPGDLSPERSNYDAPPNIDLLEQDCVFTAPLQQMVQGLVSSMMIEKINSCLADAERALARRKVENARRVLNIALRLLTENLVHIDGLHSTYSIYKRIDRLEKRFERIAKKAEKPDAKSDG